jgi:putative SOS response-associated peptidase YedK
MCYHTSVKLKASELIKAVNAPFPRADEYREINHANGFAHPDLAVFSVDRNERSLKLYNWGLIPFWVKDWAAALKLRSQTLNARSEDVFTKPSFKDSIMKRRCVIPVTGFFEWKHIGKEKIPYYIHPKDHDLFYLPGIYSYWTDPVTRDTLITFSILTGEANEFMADIHNSGKRMPLTLDRAVIYDWISPDLSPASVKELMRPCDDRNMAAYTISKDISNPKVNSDVPSIIERVEYAV